MDNFLNSIKNVLGSVKKNVKQKLEDKTLQDSYAAQDKIVKPIPAPDVLTKGQIYNTKLEDLRQRNVAEQQNPNAFTQEKRPPPIKGITFQPTKQQPKTQGVNLMRYEATPKKNKEQQVIDTIREQIPQYDGTDEQIKTLYKKYGDKLLAKIQPPPQKQAVRSAVSVMPNPSEPINADFERILNEVVFPITRQAGIPDAVAAAQAAVEGGRAQSEAAQKLNNYYGIMYWPNGQRQLRPFATPQESVQAYTKTLQNLVPNLSELDDVGVLNALQSGPFRYEGDNADPYAYVRTITSTPEFRRYTRPKKTAKK